MRLKDLKMTKVDTGAEMVIKHPVTDDATDMVFMVMGKDSKVFRDLELQKTQEFMNKMYEAQRKGKKADNPLSAEKERTEHTRKYCNVVVGWENIEDAEGNLLPFSQDNVFAILNDGGYAWLLDQLIQFVEDRTNFFG